MTALAAQTRRPTSSRPSSTRDVEASAAPSSRGSVSRTPAPRTCRPTSSSRRATLDGFDATRGPQRFKRHRPAERRRLPHRPARPALRPHAAGRRRQLEVRAALQLRLPDRRRPRVDAPSTGGRHVRLPAPDLRRGDGATLGRAAASSRPSPSTPLRTNLILAETTGRDAADGLVALCDRRRERRWARRVRVPRYGQHADLPLGRSGRPASSSPPPGSSIAGRLRRRLGRRASRRVIDNANDDAALLPRPRPLGAVAGARACPLCAAPRSVGPWRTPLPPPSGRASRPSSTATRHSRASRLPYTFRTLIGFTRLVLAAATFCLTYTDLAQRADARSETRHRRRRVVVEYANVLEQLFGMPVGSPRRAPSALDRRRTVCSTASVYSILRDRHPRRRFPVVLRG